LYNLTGGHGDDWAKAQEMGLGIDAENPLYQPGGQPSSSTPLSVDLPNDSLGASTIPHSVMPTPAHMENLPVVDTAPQESGDLVDLDLDISAPGPLSEPEVAPAKMSPQLDAFADLPSLDLPATPAPAPAPMYEAPAVAADDHGLDFDLPLPEPTPAPTAAPAPAASHGTFDLGDISLDLDDTPAPAPAAAAEFLDDAQPSDPMERKFELAEEFRQIGDIDGARELLQEVVAHATGGLQGKAKSMLDSLS